MKLRIENEKIRGNHPTYNSSYKSYKKSQSRPNGLDGANNPNNSYELV